MFQVSSFPDTLSFALLCEFVCLRTMNTQKCRILLGLPSPQKGLLTCIGLFPPRNQDNLPHLFLSTQTPLFYPENLPLQHHQVYQSDPGFQKHLPPRHPNTSTCHGPRLQRLFGYWCGHSDILRLKSEKVV